MPKCFVQECKSTSASAQRHFFGPPKDPGYFKSWESALRSTDRELTPKCKVCDLHFKEKDLIKHFRHVVEGKEVFAPRGKWQLAPNAVPHLNPAMLSAHLQCSASKMKSERKDASSNTTLDAEDDVTDGARTEIVRFLDQLPGVTLPSDQWKFEFFSDEATGERCGIFYTRRLVQGHLLVEKTVVLNEQLDCTVNGYAMFHNQLSYIVEGAPDVVNVLRQVNELKMCEGVSTDSSRGERIHQRNCSIFSSRKICSSCLRLRKQTQQARPSGKKFNVQKMKMRNLRRALLRATAAREKKKKQILNMKERLEKTSDECIEQYVAHLPPLQRLALITAFQQIKAKAPSGARYSAEWLLNCMLVRISSPKAYKLLNELKMLPLPSMSRLTQILKGIPCKYGFNVITLEAIQKQMHNKAENMTLGTLILDEIKLKQWYDFNKSTYKVDGLVDYGGVTKEGTMELADHALVFMFVPLFQGWVQPIASFATKGAAPGRVLAELVLEAIVQLHKYGATVISVVSDGAGNNKSMWQHFGVSGGITDTRHKIPHPCLPKGTFLHFICDVPHVIKCIRNHLLKHQYVQAGEHRINFAHYKVLFDTEKEEHLKVVPKLSTAHVQPNNLQRMNVRLATQLFSRSTAIGLKVYRERGIPELADSSGTEAFTRKTNDLFDALNARHPREGIRKGSKKIQVIKDYLEMLNSAETKHREQNTLPFASRQTVESLRVTLLSILDIIEELHKAGIPYILTVKLNQDPLERFFGLVRSFNGDEDHPTITQFSQIYRLLSLYTPLRAEIKGNCFGACEPVLVSFQDSLSEKSKAAAKLKLAVETKLSEKLLCISMPFEDEEEHDYHKPDVQDMVIYYLCGYVYKKIVKSTPCEECQASLTGPPDGLASTPRPPQSKLTELRSFKEGCLHHPSYRFYCTIKYIEKTVENALDTSPVFGDLFWHVLDVLEASPFPSLGCLIHHQELTARVAKFYILMRMYFFCKKKNREMEVAEKVRVARKRAKLL